MNDREWAALTEIDPKDATGKEALELKMITFSLAGKDYGIDIMQVKEISRALDFTYIPNAPYYVRGVYNLRGEIISIIDLRLLFHLPVLDRKEVGEDEDVENLIVLQFGDYYLGVVVDRVDKVCSVPFSQVQNAHPLFSDINVKYIRGLAHLEERLYILLNVDLLADSETEGGHQFSMNGVAAAAASEAAAEAPTAAAAKNGEAPPEAAVSAAPLPPGPEAEEKRENAFKDFCRSLEERAGFYVNRWTEEAVRCRFDRFEQETGRLPEIESRDVALEFLDGMKKPEEALWSPAFFEAFRELDLNLNGHLNAWCLWCGSGYDAYSLAVALLSRSADVRCRIWATDDDLLKISMAPNLTLQTVEPDSPVLDFVTETKNGFKFKKIVAEKLLFEYHSIANGNPFPQMKIIVAKGGVSFYNETVAKRIVGEIFSKLEKGGFLITENYERLPDTEFQLLFSGEMNIFQKL